MTITETIAYCAGLIDGEGCIGAWNSTSHKRAASPTAQVTVIVAMTTPRGVKLLHNTFGGTLKVAEKPEGRKRQFVWKVVSRQAESCLNQILPYLLDKREQAEVALTLVGMRRERANTNRRLSQDEISARNACVDKLKALKRVEFDPTSIH